MRKIVLRREALPADLRRLIAGYAWERVATGWSAAEVVRLRQAGQPTLYLKAEARDGEGELAAEKARLEWIGERLPVPRVHFFGADERHDYLLMSEVPGIDASEPVHARDLPRLARLLAEGMRRIHALPIAECPFDHRLDVQIEAARRRMLHGLVDETDFDPERQGRTATELFQELLATRPADEDLVFTHGDYCLPNVLIDGDRLAGFIDWGRAGVADRYQDLALSARSMAYNFGAEWVALLFEEYGIAAPDAAKVEFYKLLAEFF